MRPFWPGADAAEFRAGGSGLRVVSQGGESSDDGAGSGDPRPGSVEHRLQSRSGRAMQGGIDLAVRALDQHRAWP